VNHIAVDEDLTRPLTDGEFAALEHLKLIVPCSGCTEALGIPEDVVYHPNIGSVDDTRAEEIIAEVRALLADKKH